MSESEGSGGNAAMMAGMGCGCLSLALPPAAAGIGVVLIIFGGLGVLFAPIIALILFFGGGGGGGDSSEDIDSDAVAESVQGDGKGELDEETVPEDLAETIKDAGGVCDVIGPVVIAAQIEHESSFNKDMRGNNGEEGISQLPPDKFKEFGEDKDDNDETRATDAEDSIMAQGKYLCSLAEKVKPIVDSGQAPEDQGVLDLALAAYDVGLDAVQKAKGVPETSSAQSYVLGVRSLFPRFEGIGGALPPSEFPSPSDYPSDTETS
ncbi:MULTISPECIES: lytic transglycosylase domain-containing protein [unclassified Streptomyces]|uniref:lytic transglycosylase domain-containing protein n=1 Tax=unclassified Streptomyces TaxID=2593676 RepID=UPI002DD9CA95|nr:MULTISPECIES: lytic transglycosylase domain-containing protein [unclassified Streptomyces]WSA91376.1 lytic transglycosylase domain-containing protein [Streptomyces sp. NBC_01795]WSB75700.1 lytic transglycosylase domain-containing protein [Streptomyces sp. NBC_01775]WSS16015.1 lytic transglycosylase domain-containing protein [Streptomyces sp. NBC_01186]WSS44834.1 lytic transglycosylase domain-containing protein [Streptomyces sp. NBC_01187]